MKLELATFAAGVAIALSVLQSEPAQLASTPPPRGPFGLSLVTTVDGKPVAHEGFTTSEECALCHERQVEEFDGSLHSVSHHDPLYRAFAELARKEAGEATYAYCSGCHTPAGVVSGLVPGTKEEELPDNVTAGVQCDICHQVASLQESPWGEPGNANFTLAPGKVKATLRASIQANPGHEGREAGFLAKSEFCATCHTVIHPTNGLRIEHTYDEWKKSVYAEKGIQCQDCHMRRVVDAIEVARTLKPVKVLGRTSGMSAVEREIHPHWFVGGNIETARLSGSEVHAEEARARLKSAAEVALVAQPARAGAELAFEVAVTNIGAGHALPTSLTELREMWVHVRVSDARGNLLFEDGALDERGEIGAARLRFGSELLDAQGQPTIRPWLGVSFGRKRLIAPKGTERETLRVTLPAGLEGELTLEAQLLYRIASPQALREVMGDEAFVPQVVEMASARQSVPVAR